MYMCVRACVRAYVPMYKLNLRIYTYRYWTVYFRVKG